MTRINNNTKDRDRTRKLIGDMARANGIASHIADEIAERHICRTNIAPSDGGVITHGAMTTYNRANAFIASVIAQLSDNVTKDKKREGVNVITPANDVRVKMATRTKRDKVLSALMDDVIATSGTFASLAEMTSFLTNGGVLIIRNAQHSQSAWNIITINADGLLLNSLLYASGGHDNNAMMLLAPMTAWSRDESETVAHINEERKFLAVRVCGCPVLWRDPVGHLDNLESRGIATGARSLAESILARHDESVTMSNDVRQRIAHRSDIAGLWDDIEDVEDWTSRVVKRGHAVAL